MTIRVTTREYRKVHVRRSISRDGEGGFTIVELLIALVILLIVFSALASTIIAALGSIRNNEARVRAVALANELVEEMATIPWDQLGLDEVELSDQIAALGTDEALTYEDELVVVLDGAADAIPLHEEDIERDGRTYEVVRWVTWAEEDDLPELKRMVAIVRWQVGDQEIEIRSDGLRAPDAGELFDLEVSVVVTAADGAVNIGDPDAPYTNQETFWVTATLGDASAAVALRFRDRGGVLRTASAVDTPPGDTATRTWTIGSGSSYEFPHGRTAFTVFATGDEGQLASSTGTIRFYQNLEVQTPIVTQGGTTVIDGDAIVGSVRVDELGALCEPLTVDVDVEGLAPAESTPDADGDGGLELRIDGAGVDLQMDLVQETDFGGKYDAEVAAWGLPVGSTSALMTIRAERLPLGAFYGLDEPPFDLPVLEGCVTP